MEALFDFLKIAVLCITGLIAFTAILGVIVSQLPPDNPLRAVLAEIVKRLAMTGALAFVDIPATAVPVAGELFDIGTVVFLVYYWITLARDAGAALAPPMPRGRVIEHERLR